MESWRRAVINKDDPCAAEIQGTAEDGSFQVEEVKRRSNRDSIS